MKDIFVVIPTLDPDEKIMNTFIQELSKEFKNILVVNDGSNSTHKKFFNDLEKKGIVVFNHYRNYGKGRGLKNAFNYILNEYPLIKGVVTCDSDGQHSVKDIVKCAKRVLKSDDKLIIGVRDFDNKDVPARSKFGNKVTRNIFKLFIGLDITDTQTGLRGLSREVMTKFLETTGERYEYETNMLIACREKDIPIEEVEIDTIYIDSNAGSHFNPIKDSIKIYRLFLKFFLLSLTTYLLDILLFASFIDIINFNSRILAATILARIISSIYHYLINSNLIFKDMRGKSLIKYYTLVLIQMLISGCFTTYLFNLLGISVIFLKIIIDLIIWIVDITIKSEFIFAGGKHE